MGAPCYFSLLVRAALLQLFFSKMKSPNLFSISVHKALSVSLSPFLCTFLSFTIPILIYLRGSR